MSAAAAAVRSSTRTSARSTPGQCACTSPHGPRRTKTVTRPASAARRSSAGALRRAASRAVRQGGWAGAVVRSRTPASRNAMNVPDVPLLLVRRGRSSPGRRTWRAYPLPRCPGSAAPRSEGGEPDPAPLLVGLLGAEVEAAAQDLEDPSMVLAVLDDLSHHREELLTGDLEPIGPRLPGALLADERLAEVEEGRSQRPVCLLHRYFAATASNAGMISRSKCSTVRDASSKVMSPKARSAQK
jgi:hypothetical protein